MNHLLALLCCCVKLQDNLAEENVKTQSFDLRAAHSFCQWQSVLRDAINLNCTLLEPVLTPYIHKIYNGEMAHSLAEKLNQGELFIDKTLKIKQKIEKLKKDFNNRLTIGCMVCI